VRKQGSAATTPVAMLATHVVARAQPVSVQAKVQRANPGRRAVVLCASKGDENTVGPYTHLPKPQPP
jgi:hypothetical protein